MTTAAKTELSYDHLLHFSDHGWVLLEGVLDDAQCRAYIEALDRCAEHRVPIARRADLTAIGNQTFYDDIFLDWFKLPGILEANRQLLGARLRYQGADAHIKVPHEARHTRPDELMRPETWDWHRRLRPKWGTYPHDEDPRLVNCVYLNNITYLTAVAPGDGATAILDGSHNLEGDYASLADRCEVVQPEAPAGSVLIFTESLIHSAVPILSERTRYNMYYGFVPPWIICCWPGTEVPAVLRDSLADEELRELFSAPHYRGQHPET